MKEWTTRLSDKAGQKKEEEKMRAAEGAYNNAGLITNNERRGERGLWVLERKGN